MTIIYQRGVVGEDDKAHAVPWVKAELVPHERRQRLLNHV
jgi:hypothetical protein